MNDKQLANTEKQLQAAIAAAHDTETMKEQVGFARNIGDGEVMFNLIMVASTLMQDLRKKHEAVKTLEAKNNELLRKVSNAKTALE